MGLLMLDRANPFIGADLEEIIIPAAGAGITAYANDSVVQPIAQRILPGVFANPGIVGKLADAGTTYGVAEAVQWAGSVVSPRAGKLLGMGGKIVAGAKVLLAFLPNIYQFSAGLHLPAPQMGAAQPAALPASNPANAAASLTPSTASPASPYVPVGL